MSAQLAIFEPILIVWCFLFGACVGSFLNVCVYRIPRECLSVRKPRRSFCPSCRYQLSWRDNIPVVSWLALRGRCRSCQGSISARYPLVELATAILFGLLAWRHLPGHLSDPAAWGVLAVHGAFVSALLVCSLTDLDVRLIPDVVDVPGLLLAPVLVALVPGVLCYPPPDMAGLARGAQELLSSPFAWWGVEGVLAPLGALAELPLEDPTAYRHLAALGGSLLGAVLGAGVIYGLGESFRRLLGREAMGFGDVKLMGLIGGVVGWQGLVLTMLVALFGGSLIGLIYMLLSGRSELRGEELADAQGGKGLLFRLAAGAPPSGTDSPVVLRPGGSLLVRLGTGESTIPFGPFLSLGALLAVLHPAILELIMGLLARS